MITKTASKRDQWITAWSKPETRKVSIGEGLVGCMLAMLNPTPSQTFADFGCGTGRAARRMINLSYPCIGIDWAPNCLDDGIAWDASDDTGVALVLADIASLPRVRYADFGYCCDTLTQDMDCLAALDGIRRTTRKGAFIAVDCGDVRMLDCWKSMIAINWLNSTFTRLGDIAVFACREPNHGPHSVS